MKGDEERGDMCLGVLKTGGLLHSESSGEGGLRMQGDQREARCSNLVPDILGQLFCLGHGGEFGI